MPIERDRDGLLPARSKAIRSTTNVQADCCTQDVKVVTKQPYSAALAVSKLLISMALAQAHISQAQDCSPAVTTSKILAHPGPKALL